MQSSNSPLFGLWQPQFPLRHMYYGPHCVKHHLFRTLPSPSSKVVVVTGKSIATKTPLLQQVESLLGSRHAGTISNIQQHGRQREIEEALEVVAGDPEIDTVLSIGGGSPIDSAKMISFRVNEKTGKFLTHITIPTTLSAAECTPGGGYTKENGVKVGFMSAGMGISAIFYDPTFARYTPNKLWLATGIRAVDHAVETFYHPYATEVPWKALAGWALGTLFENLPKCCHQQSDEDNDDVLTKLLLAAYASSGFRGANFRGGMGLSHSLGHAMGSPYGIPHGETSCLTLGAVVMLIAHHKQDDAEQIARLLPAVGGRRTDDRLNDALEVGERIIALVEVLGLHPPTLTERGIGRDQIPIIVQRATGGLKEGPMLDAVTQLVERFF